MKKAILLMDLIVAVIIAGCVGSNPAALNASQTQQSQAQGAATGDASAIDSGASNVDAGVQQMNSTTPESDTTANNSDLDTGV
ncbi:Uncharacterised protein [uncultured archaeon]|nr:Uncharacterised protein [uncultured archaeon]